MAMSGVITVGTYMAYAGLVVWIIYPLRNLGRMIVQMSMDWSPTTACTRSSRESGTVGSGQYHIPRQGQGDIVFSHVSFHYDDGSEVLHDISFECKTGMAIALLGSTGSGKTTLVNLLPRFYDVSEGGNHAG